MTKFGYSIAALGLFTLGLSACGGTGGDSRRQVRDMLCSEVRRAGEYEGDRRRSLHRFASTQSNDEAERDLTSRSRVSVPRICFSRRSGLKNGV